ncbi:MAG: hypothetical protein ACK5MQ_17780 [Pikeienuella sp.]
MDADAIEYPTAESIVDVMRSNQAELACSGYEPDFDIRLSGSEFSSDTPEEKYMGRESPEFSIVADGEFIFSYRLPGREDHGLIKVVVPWWKYQDYCYFDLEGDDGFHSVISSVHEVGPNTFRGCCRLK